LNAGNRLPGMTKTAYQYDPALMIQNKKPGNYENNSPAFYMQIIL